MYLSKRVDEEIARTMPEEAQYVVNFAYRYPYFIKMNLREACHMIELRTAPQGHPDYRIACQKIYMEIERVRAQVGEGIKFVDVGKWQGGRVEGGKKTGGGRGEATEA